MYIRQFDEKKFKWRKIFEITTLHCELHSTH